jgi:DNA-binding NarL/FixJ family response regulator
METMSQRKIKLLIADDHTVVRKGLSSLLSSDKYGIEVAGEASNGNEAVEMSKQLQPDVILMDLLMPGKSGLEAIKEIKQFQPQARILVLTSYADDENVITAIQSGAYGFLLKDASTEELVHTIHSVYADKLTLPQELTHILLRGPAQSREATSEPDVLTERETDVMRCVAQGMSNKQIARQLSISTATVRSHVSSMMRKLDLENRTQIAIYAREHGLT